MSGRIENQERYIQGVLSIPVEPVILPCEECHGENYPNWRYEAVGISGVLCKPCLDKEVASINVDHEQVRNTEAGSSRGYESRSCN